MPQVKKYDPDKECWKLVERIQAICETKGMTKYALAKAADISKSTLHDLFAGKNKPYMHTLYKICNGLGISMTDLLTDRTEATSEEDTLTQEERELLIIYRHLSPEKKNNMITYIDMLTQYKNHGHK